VVLLNEREKWRACILSVPESSYAYFSTYYYEYYLLFINNVI